MRFLLLGFSIVGSACSWACSIDDGFPCRADESHFSIVVDSVQTTLTKDDVKVIVEQLPSHQSASIQNLTRRPMFTLTDQPDENLPTFVRDRKKWYVQGRYTSDDTSCAPKTAPKKPVKDLEKLDWDCSEQYDACGDVFNTNILYLPPEHYPLSWSANGLTKGKIELPPVTEQKFTQYFLHDNKIEKVALVSTLSLNEDYLKVTCDKSGKIESCGQDCVELTNLSVAIKNPSSMTFPIKTETMNFADLYEIELFVDQDYKSRLVDAGGSLVRNAAETLANMIQYGDLRKRPLDYVTVKIAKAANDDLIPLVGPGWRIQLRKPTASPSPAPSEPAAPEVSPQRNTQSK